MFIFEDFHNADIFYELLDIEINLIDLIYNLLEGMKHNIKKLEGFFFLMKTFKEIQLYLQYSIIRYIMYMHIFVCI